MISRVLTKSGIKVGNEQAPKKSEKQKLEPKRCIDIEENYSQQLETKKYDVKPLKSRKRAYVISTKENVKTAIDLKSIKRRTKLLRADVDILMETL